eukprot:gene3323-3646_t
MPELDSEEGGLCPGEEERYSTKTSYFGFDEEYYRLSSTRAPIQNGVILSVWPPIERFKLMEKSAHLILSSSSEVGIYAANPDCAQAIQATTTLEWLHACGLSSSLKSRPSDSLILIYMKRMICTRMESYEIQVRSNKIILIAADYAGAIYGLNTLKQLIMHNSIVHYEQKIKHIHLPCLLLSDAPTSPLRAVRVSLSHQIISARWTTLALVRTLSSLRINRLLIDVDFLHGELNGETVDFSELQELSRKHAIILVPVVDAVNSSDWRDTVAQLASARCEHLLILDGEGGQALQYVLRLGSFKKLFLCVEDHFFPSLQQMEVPGIVEVISRVQLEDPILAVKPLALVKPYFEAMAQVVDSNCAKFLCYPWRTERDFLSPDLLLKYYCALYAALACAGAHCAREIVQHPHYRSRLLDVILQMVKRPEEGTAPTAGRDLLLDLFGCLESVSRNAVNDSLPLVESTTSIEQSFWTLRMSDNSTSSPSQMAEEERVLKSSSHACLQSYHFYRQLLSEAGLSAFGLKKKRNLLLRGGNGSTPQGLSEVEEVFAMIDWLAFFSRASYFIQTTTSTIIPGVPNLIPTDLSASGGAGSSSRMIHRNDEVGSTASPSVALAELQNPQQKRAAVYDLLDVTQPYQIKVVPKSSEITALLTNVVRQNILFRNFKAEEHSRIVEAFDCFAVAPSEVVIKQGDPGEYFYIVESGQLEVFVESCGVHVKVGRVLVHGDYFGELALMYNTPRAATIISSTASTLWRIDRHTYRTIVTRHNMETSDEFYDLVSNVCILQKRIGDVLSPTEIRKVVSTLEVEDFEDGSVIIRQHQTGDYFYIIAEGQVDVWQDTVDPVTGQRQALGVKVATLHRGNYFGEKALLADDVRQASCLAVGRVVCLSLSRDDFIAMIGSWQDILGVRRPEAPQMRKQRQSSVYDSNYHISIRLADLDRLNTLGIGAFGRVSIARHKVSGQLYALKAQSKTAIVDQGMQEMVLTEVKIMRMIDHPLIAKLHGTMQDRKFIYFLLELLPGGEFFNFLQKVGKLSEDKSRFYAGSVMDARGYVKLVDFGLAKQLVSDSTWTMCGTPDYLAPEIILSKGHNQAVDYWALGVLIFEMVHGWPPFYHEQPMRVYEKIILGKVSYPDMFSKPLEDIVSKLLVNNPSKRLGNMKGGLADVMKHKWFGSFDWQGLTAGTLEAPYVPDLTTFDSVLAAARERSPGEGEELDSEENDWLPEL